MKEVQHRPGWTVEAAQRRSRKIDAYRAARKRVHAANAQWRLQAIGLSEAAAISVVSYIKLLCEVKIAQEQHRWGPALQRRKDSLDAIHKRIIESIKDVELYVRATTMWFDDSSIV